MVVSMITTLNDKLRVIGKKVILVVGGILLANPLVGLLLVVYDFKEFGTKRNFFIMALFASVGLLLLVFSDKLTTKRKGVS